MACEQTERGQREGLDVAQTVHLIKTLLGMEMPWVVGLVLLQLISAERADCIRQARVRWLRDLDPDTACPPMLQIEKVNGRTKTRLVPILAPIAGMLHQWLSQGRPLCGAGGSAWPFPGQDTTHPDAYLFPELLVGQGQGKRNRREWHHFVSERAYLGKLHDVAETLRRERLQYRTQFSPCV